MATAAADWSAARWLGRPSVQGGLVVLTALAIAVILAPFVGSNLPPSAPEIAIASPNSPFLPAAWVDRREAGTAAMPVILAEIPEPRQSELLTEPESETAAEMAASVPELPEPPLENLATALPNLEPSPSAVDSTPLPDLAPMPELASLPIRPQAKPLEDPPWIANAVWSDISGPGPFIAIVIDDVGIDQARTSRTIELPGPLTLAFIPYGTNLQTLTRRARAGGHELIVHMPMEPSVASADPGPNALLTELSKSENLRRLRWGLSRFDGYVGVSNHMGSQFMADRDQVEPILREVHDRGLLFLDSWTRADTVGNTLASAMDLPNTRRDVFLDNEMTVDEVRMRLEQLERQARDKGYAVAIGHPHDVTIDTLRKWIPQVRARGFTLVPISAIVRLENGNWPVRRLAAATAAGGGETNGLLGGAQ